MTIKCFTTIFRKYKFSLSTVFSVSLILLSSLISVFSRIASLIVNFLVIDFKILKASTCFFPSFSVAFICSLNALPTRKYVNSAFSIILL